MRALRTSSGGLGLVALVALTHTAQAVSDDEYQVLWIEKRVVFQHPKRDATCQSQGWSVCPASVNGGCCPNNFECDVSSCYATTAGPTTACGQVGYYGCPLTAGAGSCCPVGYTCNQDAGCDPPPDISYTQTCPTNYFACPASLGYGCCQDGKVCGSAICFDGTPSTAQVSETITTTNTKGSTITTVTTTTTVFTPGIDESTSSFPAAASVVPKLVPSSVAKESTISTGSSSSSSGLSSGALGGIVAGVVVLLVAVAAATFFILRRLRRTEIAAQKAEAAAESRRASSQPPPSGSHKPSVQHSVSEVDGTTDLDPLPLPLMRPGQLSPRARSGSDSNFTDRSISQTPRHFLRSEASSSPPMWQGPYNQVPPSDAASDGRQSSLDNYGQMDARGRRSSQQSPPLVGRGSYESGGSRPGHGRQHSDTSELDGRPLSELDSGSEMGPGEGAGRRSGSITRPMNAHVRRGSDPGRGKGGKDGDGGSGAVAAVTPQPPLEPVRETFELIADGYSHGYWGRPDVAVGETAARLNGPSTNSSAPSQHP